MTGVEVRKVELDVGETGVGVENRTDVEYQLGAEVDGVFVPFATLSEGRVDTLRQRAEREKEREAATKKATAKSGA